ncbi:MAG: ABC transporter ATP-binding protein [Bacilli bacterium]|nr:ABC transporter ATP-binding protein [Bacilli bacterium]
MIEIKDLKKDYSINNVKINALKGITCNLPERGMIFIVGRSGSGKSTLLNLLGGLDDITSGDIIIAGKNINDFSKRDFDNYRNHYIGFIFQDYNLIENISIYENIKIALSFQGINAENIIHQKLKEVGLENIKDRKPKALSGGEQQRIVIARALVKNSKIILADEPTGNLDCETATQIFSLLKKISQERLVLVVSHDKESAYQFGDRIIELKDGVVASDFEKNNISNDLRAPFSFGKEKIKLSNRLFFHISLANIKNSLWRTLFSIILLTIAILIIVSSLIMSSYSTETGTFLTVSKNKDDYIYFYDSNRNYYGEVTKSHYPINRKVLDELINDQNYVIRTNRIHTTSSSEGNLYGLLSFEYIDSIQNLRQFGFEFYEGSQEIDNDSVVVSDFFVESIMQVTRDSSSNRKYFIKKVKKKSF